MTQVTAARKKDGNVTGAQATYFLGPRLQSLEIASWMLAYYG
jgi:hypothetical protein